MNTDRFENMNRPSREGGLAYVKHGVRARFTSLRAAVAILLTLVVAIAGCTPVQSGSEHPAAVAPDGRHERALEAYANLPLSFVENQGQVDGRVRYYAQGSRYGFYFTPEEVVLSLVQPADAPAVVPVAARPQPALQGVALALRFPGGNPDVVIEGEGSPTGGQVNYLLDNDAEGWYTELSTYTGVVYQELWPGIDMILRGENGELKYEFRVQPGGNPEDITLAYAGANGLALDDEGALLIETARGVLRDSPPVSWQDIAGARVPVESHYVLSGGSDSDTAHSFAVGSYDPAHELVIDPGLDYSTFIGGSEGETVGGIAVDGQGNAYIVGYTSSTDLPTTPGAFDTTFNGGGVDVFVSKLSADGSSLVYTTYLGGTPTPLRRGSGDPWEFGRAIAVDGDGHAYVAGQTTSSNFPVTSGAFQTSINVTENPDDATDGFVTKLNPSGSGLVYSTYLGGTNFEDIDGITIDGQGNAYVTGRTLSSNFPITPGAFQSSHAGGYDAFITKLNSSGSDVVYATYLGGTDNEVVEDIVIDASGNAHVAGSSRSVDFPATPGAFQPIHPGGDFIDLFTTFVVKLNPDGSDLVYSTFLGGTKRDLAADLALDAAGHVYVTGGTLSPEFPTTPGAYDTQFTGSSESFLTKLAADGSALVFSTFLNGGPSGATALDADNNVWLAGGTSRTDAPTTEDAFSRQNSGMGDVWFGLISADGSGLLYGSYFGGVNTDGARGIALDADGNVYLAGTTQSFDFPTTEGAFQTTLRSTDPTIWGDAFVAKFGSGTGVVNPPPPPPTRTETFSGEIDKETSITHSVAIEARGTVEMHLDWEESRANLTLRARDPSGNVVFLDDSSTRPKSGTFEATVTGTYRIDLINDTRRQTDYVLEVSVPVSETTFPAALATLSVDPTTVTGGESATGTVTLTAAAPAEGAVVELVSSDPAVAAVPATITVPAGMTSASFEIPTNAVDANTSATISAAYGGVTRTATLGVNAVEGLELATLSLDPTVVTGGESSTGTATLTGAAPPGGAVVTLVSSNTDVATVPPSVTVPEGATSVTFTVSTSPQEFDQSSAISASHGGVTHTVILSVTAGSAPTLSSLTLDPTSVTGGDSSMGTVTLTAAAPLGGLVVELSSSNTAAATVPASVTVEGGNTSATFTVSTSSVSSDTSATISATLNGVTQTVVLSVNAASASPTLSSLALSPTSVTGGNSSTGTVTLSAAAPSGGASVALSSSNTAAATVPASVTVPAGSTSATFTVSTSSVSSDTSATISATFDGVTQTAVLSVTAPASTDTVTIERAEYDADKNELRVRAFSSDSSATLSVYVTATDEFIGTISGGELRTSWPTNPENVTVRSDLGGSATATVDAD